MESTKKAPRRSAGPRINALASYPIRQRGRTITTKKAPAARRRGLVAEECSVLSLAQFSASQSAGRAVTGGDLIRLVVRSSSRRRRLCSGKYRTRDGQISAGGSAVLEPRRISRTRAPASARPQRTHRRALVRSSRRPSQFLAHAIISTARENAWARLWRALRAGSGKDGGRESAFPGRRCEPPRNTKHDGSR
jgi:hypothetical protein